MTTIITDNKKDNISVIRNYYSERIKLREVYHNDNGNMLYIEVSSKVRKLYKDDILNSVDLVDYSFRFNFTDKDLLTDEIIDKLSSIIIDSIKQIYNVNLDYLDHFKIGTDLIILIWHCVIVITYRE